MTGSLTRAVNRTHSAKESLILIDSLLNCPVETLLVATAAHLGVGLRVLHGDGGAAVTPAPCSTAAGSPLYVLQLYLQHGDYVYGHIAANMSTRLYLKITIAIC